MNFKPLVLGMALAFPLSMLAQSTAMNSNGKLSNSDRQFLKKVAQEDQAEVDLAHLALQRSKNLQVQQYARTNILQEDPAMEKRAENIAQRDHVTVPEDANRQGRQEYRNLSQAPANRFDAEYMNYEASRQAKDLGVVRQELASTNDPQVKRYALEEETPFREASVSAQHISGNLNQK